MFEEYDYQAAVQFYILGYAYLNSLGWEKGCAEMGGDERSFYHWDRRVQSQHIVMTANAEVIYNWTRYVDLSKGPVVFEVPPRIRGHFYDMGMRAYVDVGDVGPDKGKGGKYLAVSADYKGKIPATSRCARSIRTGSSWVSRPIRKLSREITTCKIGS